MCNIHVFNKINGVFGGGYSAKDTFAPSKYSVKYKEIGLARCLSGAKA